MVPRKSTMCVPINDTISGNSAMYSWKYTMVPCMGVWVPQVPHMVPYMAHLWSCGVIYDPLSPPSFKNVIFTVGVKSIAKMCFPCCMGSIKKCASHGAWEAHFRLLRPLCSKTLTFFWHYYRRGVQKIENRILTEHEKQKKSASYGAWEAFFWLLQPLSTETHSFSDQFCANSGSQTDLGRGIYIYI